MSAAVFIDEFRGLVERQKRDTAPIDPAIEKARSRLLRVDVGRYLVVVPVPEEETPMPKEYTWIAAAMAAAGLALLAAAIWTAWGG